MMISGSLQKKTTETILNEVRDLSKVCLHLKRKKENKHMQSPQSVHRNQLTNEF